MTDGTGKISGAQMRGYDGRNNENDVGAYCIRPIDNTPFGKIENGKMILSKSGKIVETEWQKTADLRPDMNLILDKFVVMPNHFHAIVRIADTIKNGNRLNVCELGVCNTPLQSPSKTIGAIIRGFKSAVSKQLGYSVWQRDYFEHIIRDEKSYQKIAEYIVNNPANWKNDKFYTE